MTFDPLRSAIERGYKYLVVAGDQVFLTRENEIIASEVAPTPGVLFVIDLARHLARFDQLAPQAERFSIGEVAAFACSTVEAVTKWHVRGVFSPSLVDPKQPGARRVFSRLDLFAATILGSARRAGVSTKEMAKIAAFLTGGEDLAVPCN